MANETAQERTLKSQYRMLRELFTAAQYHADITGEPVTISYRTQRLDGTFEASAVSITGTTQIADAIDSILTTRLTQRNQVTPNNLAMLTRVRIHDAKQPVAAISSKEEAAGRFTRALRDVSDMMSTHTTIQGIMLGTEAFTLNQLDSMKHRIATDAAHIVAHEAAAPEPEPVASAQPELPPAEVVEAALLSPHAQRKEIRLKTVTDLYDTMDGLMYDLQTITSDGLVNDAQFEKLLVITRGLRELVQKEADDFREGRLAEAGHIRVGLIGFSGVLRDAAAHMDDSPVNLPQKHVLESMADVLDFGVIPTEDRLEQAWEEGQQHAKVGAFREKFVEDVKNARQDPQALFSAIFELAKNADDRTLRHLSLNYQKEFGELRKLTHELSARYGARNDRSTGVSDMLDDFARLHKMLAVASKPGFSLDANPDLFKKLILQVGKAKKAYDAQLETTERKLAESFDTYVNFAENREQGLRNWLDMVIDEANAYHPIFSVTHIASIYHRALLKVLDDRGLTADTLATAGTQQLVGELDHYLRTGDAGEGTLSGSLHEYNLTGGLKEGDLLASGAEALRDHSPYRLLNGHEAYFPDGDLQYDPQAPMTNTAEILATGAKVMQPNEILKGPDTFVPDTFIDAGDVVQSQGISGFDHRLHDQIIEAGNKGGFTSKLRQSNPFDYEEPITR